MGFLSVCERSWFACMCTYMGFLNVGEGVYFKTVLLVMLVFNCETPFLPHQLIGMNELACTVPAVGVYAKPLDEHTHLVSAQRRFTRQDQ